jgi:hypothetical protein
MKLKELFIKIQQNVELLAPNNKNACNAILRQCNKKSASNILCLF